jgi:predicted transcriptional regulator of viral defense system
MTQEVKILRMFRHARVIRARDVDREGVARVYLSRLVERGLLIRAARGLYARAGTEITRHHSLVEAAARLPDGIVCLVSALHFYGLTTRVPTEIWMAIPQKARAPKTQYPPIRAVRMSGNGRRYGVQSVRIEGVLVRFYTPAKTVADCFKFRNKVGLDLALEGLRRYRASKYWSADELWRYAYVCRVDRVIRPYLEVLG